MLEQQKSFKTEGAKLYLVPTPIGNLEDMTYRSVKTLAQVAWIASEDTRHTQKLLNHFEIQTPQVSLHEHNYKERIPSLLEKLKAGESIAQVSDAGMPSISDPGHELVVACIQEGIPVVALPGASAGITALIASGLKAQPFLFYGFLPRKKNEAKQALEQLRSVEATLIFYESPRRLSGTFHLLAEVFGNQQKAVLCRELTKIHEEYTRASLGELATYCQEEIKGECCILVEGGVKEEQMATDALDFKAEVDILIQQEACSAKVAIKKVAKRYGVKKQEVYQAYHKEA